MIPAEGMDNAWGVEKKEHIPSNMDWVWPFADSRKKLIVKNTTQASKKRSKNSSYNKREVRKAVEKTA